MRRYVLALVLAIAVISAHAEAPALSQGQTLYLPVYSHLWYGDVGRKAQPAQHPLSVLVSIRNTDPRRAIRIVSARYYDTQGKLVREYLPAPRAVPPLGTAEFYVERTDMKGGSGANFLVIWTASEPANPPMVEGLHADIIGNRTLSFVTSARAIQPE